MQGIQEISAASAAQPTVISSEDLKALLYLTIRGHNGLAGHSEARSAGEETPAERGQVLDAEKGVDIKA